MIKILKNIFAEIFKSIDKKLKFPDIKKGDIAVQVGFAMGSRYLNMRFIPYA